MILDLFFGLLAVLSLVLLLWQWLVAIRFPLHQRSSDASFTPPLTLLKPLKGCDAATEDCLRSWFTQNYAGSTQILFGATSNDPVCSIVERLIKEFPSQDAELVIINELIGTNAKIAKLAHLEKLAKHEFYVVSDADVRVSADFLSQAILPLKHAEVGLANCFYRMANPVNAAMQWEAIAINADFWSQVLQAKALQPLKFALGAAMVLRGRHVREIGGFQAIADCLADDYQLGNRIARNGHQIAICPIVVECWDSPMTWRQVWKHQLRWGRTIRVCQPLPYFLSILSNAGWWALLWLGVQAVYAIQGAELKFAANGFEATLPLDLGMALATAFIAVRIVIAFDLQRRLTRSTSHGIYFWLAPFKDLLQTAVWFCAFAGNTIEWRGQKYALNRNGTLRKHQSV